MTTECAKLLAPDGAIARRIDGFEIRPQQLEMADKVAATLESRGQLLVEAGTGVGKSFAYLLPAIRHAIAKKERVIISTHTIALQEQLIEKDLPLLAAVLPEEFTAVLVKGRSNYVSIRRLKQASSRQERLFPDEEARHALHVLEDWAYDTSDGTRQSLPQAPRGDVWDHVQSDAHNCMGRKCAHHEECFFQRARRRMENANILVCNHALFFSDLALRGGGKGFLPNYEHIIFDEAHGIEDVAAEHFGVSLAETRVAHLLRLLYDPRHHKGFLDSVVLKDGETKRLDDTIELTLRCRTAAEALFNDLEYWQLNGGAANGRVDRADIVPNALSPLMAQLAALLRLLRERAVKEADQFELAGYSQRAEDIGGAAASLLGQRIEGCVYFIEGAGREDRANSRRRRRRIVLRCMTVDVSPVLRDQLFGKEQSVIMTSATLATTPGDFGHVAGRLGCENAAMLELGSPFDFGRQMRVLVDERMPAPSDGSYLDALAPRIEDLVRRTDGGAFVLFTSFSMLDRAASALRDGFADAGLPFFVHGADGPPGLLLRRFREDPRSVLFGTASFWQGVDVRGEGLRNVIITRLPFDVPDRPIVEARHERIRESGGHPFFDDQVPRAVIRFRQGVGRLIRSGTDRGVVSILDPRIVTKGYGKAFQRALPNEVVIESVHQDNWQA